MFRSFFLAGFECATGYNVDKQAIDQICATQHDEYVRDDYDMLVEVGIQGVREGVRWPLVEIDGEFDFATVGPFIKAARETDVEVIWDLFHYGFPDDIDLFTNEFAERFANYCYAAAKYIGDRTDGPCYFTPINEPSFFAWAAGDACLFRPHLCGRGVELKYCLARAAIAGINAIWRACPNAVIVNVDPVCRVVTPPDRPDLEEEAADFNNNKVFESWDMVAGRLHPELGGSRKHLGVVGINYYWTNQWEIHRAGVPLRDSDPRRAPLSQLIKTVHERYGGDLLITETSHVGEMREVWMSELSSECERLLSEGIPLRGVCIYPVLGMPEWHEPGIWTRMGLWDLEERRGKLARVPYEPMLRSLREAQARLEVAAFQRR